MLFHCCVTQMQKDAAAGSTKPFKDAPPEVPPAVEVGVDEEENYSDGDFEDNDAHTVPSDDENARHAATRIQAIHRGNAARQDLRQRKAASGQEARRALAGEVDAVADNLVTPLPTEGQDVTALEEGSSAADESPLEAVGGEDRRASVEEQISSTAPESESLAVSHLGEGEVEADRGARLGDCAGDELTGGRRPEEGE